MGFSARRATAMAILAMAVSIPSQATLGEHERTVEADRRMFHAQAAQRQDGAKYHVHQIMTDSRQLVREYALPDGTIFAITWRGAHQPDLEQLFGTYYKEYVDAEVNTAVPPGRAPKITSSTNITVSKFGHMGDVRGKAVIPQFVPDGVSARDLQ
jgi:hypothetical protein